MSECAAAAIQSQPTVPFDNVSTPKTDNGNNSNKVNDDSDDSGDEEEVVDEVLAALAALPEGERIELTLGSGSLGCGMRVEDIAGASVIRVDHLQATAQDGVLEGDIVVAVNGVSCVDRDMGHFLRCLQTGGARVLSLLRLP